jgi:N-acetylneuraminic acid mutarotase
MKNIFKKQWAILGLFGALVSGAASAQTAAPAWHFVGNMTATRDSHTTTRLANGQVLVAGGNGSCNVSPGNPCGSAELFNPATGMWTATGSLITPRASHTAILLANGKVLVAGGFTATAELYDPLTGQWTATGTMSTSRAKQAMVLLPNGKVLVAGGVNSVTDSAKSAEIYDPATGVWTPTGSMTTGRMEFTLTLLPNQMVLAASGLDLKTGATNTAELYNPATGQWTPTGSLATGRLSHTATLLSTGKVLVAAGSDGSGFNFFKTAELYDPATGTWAATGSLALGRSIHTTTLMPGGSVLAVGGIVLCTIDGNCISTGRSEIYNPATGTWSASATIIPSRSSHTATALGNGIVLVTGGLQSKLSGDTDLATASVFIP